MAKPTIHEFHGSFNVTRRTQAVRYIVCHYTGSGTSAAGSAEANCRYFGGGNRNASAHYFVDDSGIWEYADPSAYATWHCGDGHGRYGITNANSIGIEVCQDGDRPYTSAEIAWLAQLVRWLMERFGVDAAHVVRHYDASRKACPYYYTPSGSGGDAAWRTLHAAITGGAASATATSDEEDDNDMNCIIQPDGANVLVYFDGHDFHDLTHPDDVKALNMVYQQCHGGKDIPCFKLGTSAAPWFARLAQAVHAGEPSSALVPTIDGFKPRTPKEA